MGSIAIHGTLHLPVRDSFGAGRVILVVLLTLFALVFAYYSLKHITGVAFRNRHRHSTRIDTTSTRETTSCACALHHEA